MHELSFDSLTKRMVSTSSRRSALRLLAGGALASALGRLGLERAGANQFGCRPVGKPCTKKGQCCSGVCRGPKGKKTCRAHGVGTCTTSQNVCLQSPQGAACNNGVCTCFVTTGGARFCADPGGTICTPCGRDADCLALGFPAGSACVVAGIGLCTCTGTGTACVQPCPAQP